MKCQKCEMNEVNFHYSSNVNGCVTEAYLCSNCAAESGYLFPIRRGISGFMQMAVPMIQAGAMFPFTMRPGLGKIEQGSTCSCGCGSSKTGETNVEVDEVMKERRELSAQMRAAVEKEEFEKAAELRDRIKELEAGRKMKCDSETTSQDSQPAQ